MNSEAQPERDWEKREEREEGGEGWEERERDWEKRGGNGRGTGRNGRNGRGHITRQPRGRAKEVIRASADACRFIISEVVLAHFALIPKWSCPTLL